MFWCQEKKQNGVRQGCVLSPILYALFINGLIDELNEANLGVEISPGVLLDCLLYADDIVNNRQQRKVTKVVRYSCRVCEKVEV